MRVLIGRKGVPVIRDPFVGEGEQAGDVEALGGSPFQAAEAASACDQEWQRRRPQAQGLVIVTVRRFLQAGGHSRPPRRLPSRSGRREPVH